MVLADANRFALRTTVVKFFRRLAFVFLAALASVYGGLAVWSVMLHRQGLTATPFEALLVFGVYYPVWVCTGGPWESELEGFQYALETLDGSTMIRYEVNARLSGDDIEAPLLFYSEERLNVRSVKWLVREGRVRLSSGEADAMEKAITRWRGPRQKPHRHAYGSPWNSQAKYPLLFFKAEVRKPGWAGLYTDAWTWEDWQIDGAGIKECSKARSLIRSINQALGARTRERHALPLPPQAESR